MTGKVYKELKDRITGTEPAGLRDRITARRGQDPLKEMGYQDSCKAYLLYCSLEALGKNCIKEHLQKSLVKGVYKFALKIGQAHCLSPSDLAMACRIASEEKCMFRALTIDGQLGRVRLNESDTLKLQEQILETKREANKRTLANLEKGAPSMTFNLIANEVPSDPCMDWNDYGTARLSWEDGSILDLDEERARALEKVMKTTQFKQMKRMINAKNEQVESLRRRLREFEPEEESHGIRK